MNAQSYINKLKGIEEKLLKFLDYGDDEEENYENLRITLIDQDFITDPYQLKMFLYLLNKISKHHHRSKKFFDKIQKLIKLFQKEMTQFFSNWTIFKIFSKSKRIVLFLIEEKIITMDIEIYRTMFRDKYRRLFYPEFFSPEIESFVDKEFDKGQKKKEKISNAFHLIDNFYEKRKKSDFLYNIIQQDLIEEFIIFVNKNSYQINNQIEITIFETNNFLMLFKSVSLIALAVFFGSDQIFKYLYKNGVELGQDLWIFAIYSENPEIIQILEEKIGKIKDNTDWYYVQAIKCHHNDMANYIRDNYLIIPSDQIIINRFNEIIFYFSFRFYNFLYIQEITNFICTVFYASKYDYFNLVKLLLTTNTFELYQIIILYYILNCIYNYN